MTKTKVEREILKDIIHKYWLFSHFSIRKIAAIINADKKYGTISHQMVSVYVRDIKREAERWIDEDVIEKYTGEFVRKQMAYDDEIDKISDAMELCDKKDMKELDLWLKLLNAKHSIEQDQLRNMTEIELVLRIKTLSADQRKKFETLKKVPPKEVADMRGYHLLDTGKPERSQVLVETTDASKEVKSDSNN